MAQSLYEILTVSDKHFVSEVLDITLIVNVGNNTPKFRHSRTKHVYALNCKNSTFMTLIRHLNTYVMWECQTIHIVLEP